MIKLSVKDTRVAIEIEGERVNCATEAVLAFIKLADSMASALDISFEQAALAMYQNGVTGYKINQKAKNETV